MRPERTVQPATDRVWMVAQWKWELDQSTPWYRKAFFRYIFRPFIHFAWNVMKVPTPKGAIIEGNKQTFLWFENGGFFSSEDQAELACIDQWHGYKDVPLNRSFPPESAQYSSLVFPRQKNPRQHRKRPTFSIIAKDRKEDERQKEIADKYFERLHQALER